MLTQLKWWCIAAPLFESKAAHQGGRKLPELTREQAQTTEETLARMKRELQEP